MVTYGDEPRLNVSEGLNSVETFTTAGHKIGLVVFQKDLIVWKLEEKRQ